MKLLFDSNLIIPAEPTSPGDIEPGTPIVVELIRLIHEESHQMYLHPAAVEELERDRDPIRREMRATLLAKYPVLPAPPMPTPSLEQVIGVARAESHDVVDHFLLAAVERDAVDVLVSDDRDLRRKAHRAGLRDRVLRPADCAAMLRGLFRNRPLPPPAVTMVLAHQLDETDPIFGSFRHDYPDFDRWLTKCKREHRRAWVVRQEDPALAAFCIVKDEPAGEYGIPGPALKICSFKISDAKRGFRFGELLLKAVFSYAFANPYKAAFVTVFPRHEELIALFEDHGFSVLETTTALGERVLSKRLVFSDADYRMTPPLEFGIRFGPKFVKMGDLPTFVVPIQPRYHALLFPETENQTTLFPGRHAFGNSIAKAYLCHASAREIPQGSALAFYRSRDHRRIECVGVTEDTLVSADATAIARFVGKRTVYSYDEIERMCEKPTLAILFRFARTLDEPLPLAQLLSSGVLLGPPQSITRVREEGREWLRTQIEEWS